jgi:ureidoglycolate lyase
MPEPTAVLPIEPLTAAAFQPFGDVIEASASRRHFSINDGFAERYHDLARVELGAQGRAIISIFKALPRTLPMQLRLLERHPLGSQAFMPLSALPYLVVVAQAGELPQTSQLRCFAVAAGQGVNYARGTWHHPLIALHQACDFLVIDRGGAPNESNCDEYPLADSAIWIGGEPPGNLRCRPNTSS